MSFLIKELIFFLILPKLELGTPPNQIPFLDLLEFHAFILFHLFLRLSQARLLLFRVAISVPTAHASKFCLIIWLLLYMPRHRNLPFTGSPYPAPIVIPANGPVVPRKIGRPVLPAHSRIKSLQGRLQLRPGEPVKLQLPR